MRINFTYTLEELREGLAPATAAAGRTPIHKLVKFGAIMLGLTVVVVLLTLFILIDATLRYGTFAPQANRDFDLVGILLLIAPPAAAFMAWYSMPVLRMLINRDARTGRLWIRFSRALPLLCAAIVIQLLLLCQPIKWRCDRVDLIAILACAGVVVAIWCGLMYLLTRRLAVSRQVRTNPALTREREIELADQHLRLSDGITESTHAWSFFPIAWETTHLLVLRGEDGRAFILPKRAFTDDTEIDAAKSLLSSHIATVQFRPSSRGFPVTLTPAPAIADVV